MKPDEVVAAFDRLAFEYDTWYRTPLGAFADDREKEAVFALAGSQPGERALAVGCGTGNYTLALARRAEQRSGGAKEQGRQGDKVIGVDPTPAMLTIAASKAKEAGLPVCFAQAVAEDLPFPAESFDLVVSVTTLEFVASPYAAVVEMMRVLRPSGRLVIGVLNAWSLWALAYRRRKGTVYELAHFFSPSELIGLLRPYGRVTWRSALFAPPRYPGWPGALAEAVEHLGAVVLRPFGAFLAAKVEKER